MIEPTTGRTSSMPWEAEVAVALWRDNPGYAVIDIPWGEALNLTERLARLGGVRTEVRRDLARLGNREPIIIHLRRGWKVLLFRSERRDGGCSPEPFIVCPDEAPQRAATFDSQSAAHEFARSLGPRSGWAWFHARRHQGRWIDPDGIAWDSYLNPVLCSATLSDPFWVYDTRRVQTGANA